MRFPTIPGRRVREGNRRPLPCGRNNAEAGGLTWLEAIPTGQHGTASATVALARQMARADPSGWYVAALDQRWMIAKFGAQPGTALCHVVKGDGMPLLFESAAGALAFLRGDLKVRRAAILQSRMA